MVELIEYMVKALVDNPEAVRVETVRSDGGTIYEVNVAPGDLGRVIGRHGRIANALRSVVKAAAIKANTRASLEIVS